MNNPSPASQYLPAEEFVNIASHAIGCLLSIIAMMFLLQCAISLAGALDIASFGIFGLSLSFLYATSTIYHSSKDPQRPFTFILCLLLVNCICTSGTLVSEIVEKNPCNRQAKETIS